ncbi:hypothetical protein [Limnobaculum xujianqingii]|uniref:hypothetical protein n=1 Tax=Limnobaculum xujianqingii TaxID=2738837 RepID=UPI0015BAE837|nr:hypothetical protein [Limnobaculum xujianqingii]
MTDKLARLAAVFDELGKKQIKVGFFEHSKYPDDTPIAYVAAIQELGHPAGGIPPRPFMRPSVNDNQRKYANGFGSAAKKALSGESDVTSGLAIIGQVAAGDIQLGIQAVTTPALKPATVAARARKHSKGKATAKPLVYSGLMLQAVTSVVEDK